MGDLGKQARALGAEARKGIRKALLAGAKVMAPSSQARVPLSGRKHTGNVKTRVPLKNVVKADVISKTDNHVAGVTVEGGFPGEHFYVKFPEYGANKISARSYIQLGAMERKQEAVDAVAETLRSELDL